MGRFLHALALLLAVFGASAAAQESTIARPDEASLTPAQVDSTVNRLIEAAHVTGTGVALFHHGKIVYLKTYGFRDVKKNLPLTPDTVMSAASLTKPAFATVVMRLVQRGVLDLDKPIEQYLGKPLGDFAPYSARLSERHPGPARHRVLARRSRPSRALLFSAKGSLRLGSVHRPGAGAFSGLVLAQQERQRDQQH